MTGNTRDIQHRTDATTVIAAADRIRDELDYPDAQDLAALLGAVGRAMWTTGSPPLGDIEMWRWSECAMVARRIAQDWQR